MPSAGGSGGNQAGEGERVEIVAATRNPKKLEEIKRILGGSIISIRTLVEFPECPELVEDGQTFEENAVKKAVLVARYTGRTTLADDSGLEVSALGGGPGVSSARYAGEKADDRANLAKLLQQLREVGDEDRRARFVCCIALAFPAGVVRTFWGYVEGSVGREPKGSLGFGYDPVFYPNGESRTFAEMDADEKDAISHRGMALRALKRYLTATAGASGTEGR